LKTSFVDHIVESLACESSNSKVVGLINIIV